MTSLVIRRVLRQHQSPVKDNGEGYLVHACCSLTHYSIPLHSQALAHQEINPSGRPVKRDGAGTHRSPGCRGIQKPSTCSGKTLLKTATLWPRPPGDICGKRFPAHWCGTGSSMTSLWPYFSLSCLHCCLTTLCNGLFSLQINRSAWKARDGFHTCLSSQTSLLAHEGPVCVFFFPCNLQSAMYCYFCRIQ